MKIPVRGVEINVTRTGSGNTSIVFLHFWGGSSRTWSEVASRMADGNDCIALDFRGQGQSGAPRDGYAIADLASDVQAVIESLGVSRYVLVGHSMGGKTAQLIASRRPAGLVGVALVASSPPSPMTIPDAQREQMKLAYATRDAATWTLDNVLLGSPVAPEIRERTLDDMLKVSQAAVQGWVEVGTRDDLTQAVARVDVPVTIMAGRLDRVDPVEVVRLHLAPYYKSAPLSLLDGKGHLLPLEAPEEVATILRSFIESL